MVLCMALLGREFIAVPDDRKGQIVFKWPDITIRRYTRAIVNADEMAMFVNTGQVVQTLGPGRHQIDANELPGLGAIINAVSGGNAYRAELYFVGTREYTGFKFGGRVDDVQDPRTGLVVTLRVFGDYALRVVDPVRLVTNLTATVDVTDNERISGWVSDQLLKVLRTHVTTQIIRNGWPILGLMAYSAEIEQATIEAANGQLVAYGVQLTRMGNFDVNLSPEDEKQLKQLAKDTSYSQLAGGFQNYAQGEMALGAGQGMAQGGAGVDGAFLGAGFGLASAMGAQQVATQQAQQAGRPAGGGPAGHAAVRSWWPAAVRRRALWPRCPASAAAASAAAGPAGPASVRAGVRVLPGAQPGGRAVLHGLRPAARARRPALHRVRRRTPGQCPLLRRLRHQGRRLRAPRGAGRRLRSAWYYAGPGRVGRSQPWFGPGCDALVPPSSVASVLPASGELMPEEARSREVPHPGWKSSPAQVSVAGRYWES